MRKPFPGMLPFICAVLCGTAMAAIVPVPGTPLHVRSAPGGADPTRLQGALDIQAGTLLAGGGIIDVQGPIEAKVTALMDTSSGVIHSADALHLSTATLKNRLGLIQSQGDATIASGCNCKNTRGTVRADGVLKLHVGGILKNRTGTIQGGDAAEIEVNGRLNNAGGRVLSFGPSLRVGAPAHLLGAPPVMP